MEFLTDEIGLCIFYSYKKRYAKSGLKLTYFRNISKKVKQYVCFWSSQKVSFFSKDDQN